MLKFQLMTEKDRREAAMIERRRMQEEERKKRLFNPRQRLIGVDTEGLKTQIEEKRRLDAEQKQIDKLFEEQLKKADEVALVLAKKQQEEVKKVQQEINNFRQNCQKPQDRREFDLNDPLGLKKQLPCRVHDEDPRLGPSSAQKFEGEDLVSEQRAKVQREQIRSWLDQQMLEKEQAERERKMAEDAYKAAVIARDQRAIELDNLEKTCRRKLDEATKKYNLALAEDKCRSNHKKMQENLMDNTAELYNTLTSDMLTENTETCQSNMGPGRKLSYVYKGMSAEEIRAIRQEQLLQIEEHKKMKELEARMQREFDDYMNGTQKSIYLMNMENERRLKEERKKMAQENLKLAEEQKSRKNYLEKIVYTNRAGEDFFDQFNKTAR